MRYLPIIGLTLALVTTPVAAQSFRVDFITGEDNASATTLTTLPINRGWSDSVSAYINDELRGRTTTNLVRVNSPGLAPNYRLVVQPLPAMTTDNKPSGLMIYAAILLRRPSIGSDWIYLNSILGYTRRPADVAQNIVNFITSAVPSRH